MPKRKPGSRKQVREEAVKAYRVRTTLASAVARGKVVPAADFKANCLSLMDQVRDNGSEFVVTKHGEPVARLVPVLDSAEQSFIGRGRGLMTVKGDIVAPTAPDWEYGADL